MHAVLATPTSAPCPLRVFIVENHVDTLKYMRMYLELFKHEVMAARTVAEALATLPGADCDVLISDIGLPDGTGWDVLERVRLPRRIYAVAMSGLGTSTDYARSKEAGFRHHLLKPFRPEELDALLAEATRELARANG